MLKKVTFCIAGMILLSAAVNLQAQEPREPIEQQLRQERFAARQQRFDQWFDELTNAYKENDRERMGQLLEKMEQFRQRRQEMREARREEVQRPSPLRKEPKHWRGEPARPDRLHGEFLQRGRGMVPARIGQQGNGRHKGMGRPCQARSHRRFGKPCRNFRQGRFAGAGQGFRNRGKEGLCRGLQQRNLPERRGYFQPRGVNRGQQVQPKKNVRRWRQNEQNSEWDW